MNSIESSPRPYEQWKSLNSSNKEEEKERLYERTFDTTFQSMKATNDKAESDHHTRSYSDYDSMSDEGEDQDPFFRKYLLFTSIDELNLIHEPSRDGRKSDIQELDFDIHNEFDWNGAISGTFENWQAARLVDVIKEANVRFINRLEMDYAIEDK